MENLITEIKNKLYEELGVADIVTTTSNDILAKIIKHSKTIPSEERTVQNFKEGNFDYVFENHTIKVNYTIYYVNKYNDIERSISTNRGFSKKWINNTFILKTTIVYAKDINKYVDYNGNLQHEMEHIYQMIKSGTALLTKKDDIKLYQKAEELKNSNDMYAQFVGHIIYYGFKFERDAFANSVYREIMNNPNSDPYEIVKSTTTYYNIEAIKKCVLDTDAYKEKFADIVKNKLGKSYNWFYRLTNNVVKTYIQKIGKAYAKAYKDLNDENPPLDGGTFGVGEIPLLK